MQTYDTENIPFYLYIKHLEDDISNLVSIRFVDDGLSLPRGIVPQPRFMLKVPLFKLVQLESPLLVSTWLTHGPLLDFEVFPRFGALLPQFDFLDWDRPRSYLILALRRRLHIDVWPDFPPVAATDICSRSITIARFSTRLRRLWARSSIGVCSRVGSPDPLFSVGRYESPLLVFTWFAQDHLLRVVVLPRFSPLLLKFV